MTWASTSTAKRSFSVVYVVLLFFVLVWGCQRCDGFGSFGFDIHHRFSDPVMEILGSDGLPEKGSLPYYAAMTYRDQLIKRRHLASDVDRTTPLAFSYGKETFQLPFGYLYYANVSVGTPSSSYLVALDTGSNLFWLPCDCSSCVRGAKLSDGTILNFNIYSPNKSSTSEKVPCSSSMCVSRRCAIEATECPYQAVYLSNGTSSTGILVEDVLHLITDDDKQKNVEARITFGCGKVQTGSFLSGGAPNGLFGLGMKNTSVPSILASKGVASNSFSMCFGPDGMGRIKFGDNGSLGQGETPFNFSPLYNVTLTQISLGGNPADLEFSAIFDSGTTFTYLNDPAYTQMSESFNMLTKEKRLSNTSDSLFEYCYELSPNQTKFEVPELNLTMKGGDQYFVFDPILQLKFENGKQGYCLAVVKSEDVNIIGQNFMTGYRITFDREKKVLGWKESNCYNDEETNTIPITPSDSPAISPNTNLTPEVTPSDSPAISPNTNLTPEATSGTSNSSHIPAAYPPSENQSPELNFYFLSFILILFPFFAFV